MREFPNPKALQDYVKLHKLTYLWEGTRSFARRFAQLSPERCEVASVATRRGTARALLFPRAILLAEWVSDARSSRPSARGCQGGGRKSSRARRHTCSGIIVGRRAERGRLKPRARWPPPCWWQEHE